MPGGREAVHRLRVRLGPDQLPDAAIAERLPRLAPAAPGDRRRRVLGARGARRRARLDADPGRHDRPGRGTTPGRAASGGRCTTPGVQTLVMSAADMAARAQIIRGHNYAMDGVRRPEHAIPPAPIVTSTVLDPAGASTGEGSAGARNYSIQRASAGDRGGRSAGAASPISTTASSTPRGGERGLVPRDPVQPRRQGRPRLEGRQRELAFRPRAVSSAGRAPGLHPGGRRFDPVTAHSKKSLHG